MPSARGSNGGRLLGGLIAGLVTGRARDSPLLGPDANVEETDLAELPEEVTDHPDWPLRDREGQMLVSGGGDPVRPLFVLEVGIFLQWTGRIRVEPPFFGRKKVLAFLRDTVDARRDGLSEPGA